MALDFSVPSITFKGPVPIGGMADLTIQEDGFYSFSGKFHNGGLPPYDVVFVMTLTSSNGTVLTFTKSVLVTGSLSALIDNSNQNASWSDTGTNPKITEFWAGLQESPVVWKAEVSTDAVSVISDTLKAVAEVVPVVVSVVPIL